jgi:hypothetical protein
MPLGRTGHHHPNSSNSGNNNNNKGEKEEFWVRVYSELSESSQQRFLVQAALAKFDKT